MEQHLHSTGECRRVGSCSMDQLSTVQHSAPTNETLPSDHHSTNAHTVTRHMTSSVTRTSSCQSPNRGELTHFCCCLHRRRMLLKKWSRRHREEASRPSVARQGSSNCPQLHIRQPMPSDTTLSHHDSLSLIDTSFSDNDRAYIAADPTLKVGTEFEKSDVNERLKCEMSLSSDDLNKLCRSNLTSCIVGGDSRGAEIETPWGPLPEQDAASLQSNNLKLHGRLHPPITQCAAGAILGQFLLDLASSVSRLVPSGVKRIRRLVGGGQEGRPRGRCESRTPSGLNPAAQVTFHRWVIVLLVCIMVLPVNSTAAPGPQWMGGSVVEEPGNEPGYKNSFYQELPPKAEYESVIICLLAVSAFIGLIVWVLKSNFEERQQKRMRREASLRERTSSVAFLKT